MAKTIKCRACGAQVSKSAKSCPSCGEPAKKKAGPLATLVGCLVLCVGFVGCLAVFGSLAGEAIKNAPPPKPWNERDASTLARLTAEDFVRERLKSPSTADFPGIFDGAQDHVTAEGDQVYRIKSWVDSQNAFGATVRTRYFARVRQVGENRWELVDFTFE